ncbi:MAG: hypothetical protein H7829_04545 [Magnetococcus sp. THC-1_WYH]
MLEFLFSIIDLVWWVLKGMLDAIIWVISRAMDVAIWLAGRVWDGAFFLFLIYKEIAIKNIVIFIVLLPVSILIYLGWKKYNEKNFIYPNKFWKTPGVAVFLSFPIIVAILGIVFSDRPEGIINYINNIKIEESKNVTINIGNNK